MKTVFDWNGHVKGERFRQTIQLPIIAARGPLNRRRSNPDNTRIFFLECWFQFRITRRPERR
ncbi:MAG TPA: hypothetical protein VFA77_10730, partial [Candidatus Eisenbacteria bacterium]|nr:hypothetical protein [Candidatus Eisenbacteria bacterium]